MNLNYKDVKKKYGIGLQFISNPEYIKGQNLNELEQSKRPFRYEIINFLLSKQIGETNYLEIGVRNPDDNFNKINATNKYSVDPGIEFEENPVDFPITSDDFFKKLKSGEILNKEIKFDVIFIDGLHLADQVWRDILNSEEFLSKKGFIVLHDCNPPTEWHTRVEHKYINTPAYCYWNGTTWKGFVKYRQIGNLKSCCIDTDWGVGIISNELKTDIRPQAKNDFFEFDVFDSHRKEYLHLVSFEDFKKLVN
jgi:hypothetical protein